MPLSPVFSLTAIDGSNGFRTGGEGQLYFLGRAVSFIGDINGDGIEDLALGSPGAGVPPENESGFTYVLFGRREPWPADFNLATLDGTSGFKVRCTGVAQVASGESVAAAGDVNGDGVDDFVIGAHLSSAGGQTFSGSAFVIYGKTTGWSAEFDLASVNGANGFRLDGEGAGDLTALNVSGAGDVNGDGLDDIMLGARQADRLDNPNAGAAYVVFGSATAMPTSLSVSALNGANGFRFEGRNLDDLAGEDVAIVGDVNGDGIADMLITAPNSDPILFELRSEVYLLFGKSTGWAASLSPGDLNGSTGVRFRTAVPESLISAAVAAAGDVNGDGLQDFIIGTLGGGLGPENARGGAYVVFGRSTAWPSDVNLSTLNGSDGFLMTGTFFNEYAGVSVSGGGDINGDGFDDLVIGATGPSPGVPGNAGAAYVVYGKASGWPASFSLSALDGTNGFKIKAAAATGDTGFSVSNAGDLNGDGFDDIAIGSPNTPSGSVNGVGAVHVIFGEATGAISRTGTPSIDWLYGGSFADTIQGLAGNDHIFGRSGQDFLYGNGGADTIEGGDGDDFILPGDGPDSLIGGNGFDAVFYGDSAAAVSVDLATGVHGGFAAGDAFTSIEAYLLSAQGDVFIGRDDPGAGDIVYGLDGADSLSGLGGFDYLLGGNGDDTLEGGLGWDLSTGGAGADRFVFRTGGDGGAGPGGGELITDFQTGIDKIVLVSASTGFATLTLGTNLFIQSGGVTGLQGTATGPALVYDQASGGLWLDSNGSAAGGLSWLAGLLAAPTLTPGDFMLF